MPSTMNMRTRRELLKAGAGMMAAAAVVPHLGYGAFVATTALGNFEGIVYGPATPFLEPDNYLYTLYYPGHPRNMARVNDPTVTDLLIRQRRSADPAKRREIIYEIQRHLAAQQYNAETVSAVLVAVWDGVLKNYGPNLGYDYGGRLVAAWLER